MDEMNEKETGGEVTIMFQAMGAQPRPFTVDEGTTLGDFIEGRAPTSDYIVLVNTEQVDPESYVLQDKDVVFANQRRSYG